MAYAAINQAETTSSIELLAARLQMIIRSRSAQEAQCVVVYKAPDENQRDWDLIIAAIDETDGVHVITHDDGSARISWDVPYTIQRANRVRHVRSHQSI